MNDLSPNPAPLVGAPRPSVGSRLLRTVVATVLYFAWFAGLVGLRPEHSVLYGIMLFLYWSSRRGQRLLLALSPLIAYWIIYDSLRIMPNYTVGEVHIASLYNAEKQLFGIGEGALRQTPNEWFATHSYQFIDVLSGFWYLSWVPVPLLVAIYWFLTNKERYARFVGAFVFVNILGFIVYYLYPAAPPWYVAMHGFNLVPQTLGSTAGLSRFDAWLGVEVFKGIYAKNSNVFAAMPSLHSAYPVVVAYYVIRAGRWPVRIGAVLFAVGIWLAAVYTSHHYILDVLAGITCALVGVTLWEGLITGRVGRPWFRRFVTAIQ
ncbi:phosphatase PAP2 family protein [Spirosoma rigui]|uniref:phosphatase PAP2 family protein n=1 Tax=Spirosoma rigui TaxID=564064 RepID=UPI0009B09878|nr:phosphatase PAP2 family protein [Spirosoma rigui]